MAQESNLLPETPMLDYSHPSIQALIQSRGWKKLLPYECICAIYNFVRDEILFGYNTDDSIPASKVPPPKTHVKRWKKSLLPPIFPLTKHFWRNPQKTQNSCAAGSKHSLKPCTAKMIRCCLSNAAPTFPH